MKDRKHVGIRIEDGSVELNLEGPKFDIGLDERGSPLFTESVRQQLPPYIPEFVEKLVEKMIKEMGSNRSSSAWVYLNVEHEDSCAESTDIGICDCNPFLRDHKIEEYIIGECVTLTCAVCDESITGKKGACDEYDQAIRFWMRDGDSDKGYWRFAYDKSHRLFCEDCARKVFLKGGWPQMTPLERFELVTKSTNTTESEGNAMPEKRYHRIRFKEEGNRVQITVDELVFKVRLDKYGFPVFPEWVRQKLSPQILAKLERKLICEGIWKPLWRNDDGMSYYTKVMGPNKSKVILCQDCLNLMMKDVSGEMPQGSEQEDGNPPAGSGYCYVKPAPGVN